MRANSRLRGLESESDVQRYLSVFQGTKEIAAKRVIGLHPVARATLVHWAARSYFLTGLRNSKSGWQQAKVNKPTAKLYLFVLAYISLLEQ